MSKVEVITYDKKFLPEFVSLNQQWIEHYFKLEQMDIQQLNDPEGTILNHGGEIFFVVEDGKAVGTCAMVAHGDNAYELAKMAVSPDVRGKGYGNLLMEVAIGWARSKGIDGIMLLSNTVLEPAIALYIKYGFQVISLGTHPDYARCNIQMALYLKDD